MQTVVLDFETFYSVKRGGEKFSLSTMTTESYINDPRFQVLGCATKTNDEETVFVSGGAVAPHLAQIPWDKSLLVAHNATFDGSILAWVFGHTPKMYIDTLSLARLLDGVVGGVKHSLAACSERHNVGEKGTELFNTDNKRLEDFDSESLAALGKYCINDVELTYRLFKIYMGKL
tara:strand:- start:17586 stop:18110 length:525 start_codon:yes stop_codon:yes gene_type:complete